MALSAATRRNLSVVAAVAIAIAAVYGLVRAFTANWDEVRRAWREADWWLLGASVPVAALAVVGFGERWHATLRALGADLPRGRALRWFFTGQLGKYAPGGVWHVVGQGELAARGGVARRTAYAGVMLSTVILVGGAALTVAVGAALPVEADTPWWAVGVGAGIVAALFVAPVRRRILRAAGVTDGTMLPPRRLLLLVVGSVPAWIAVGVTSWMVSEALHQHAGVARTMIAAVASWLVGIVTLPAPGGIGVREAVFAAGLTAGGLSTGSAALVALIARLVFVVADVVLFLAARAVRPGEVTAVSEPSTVP